MLYPACRVPANGMMVALGLVIQLVVAQPLDPAQMWIEVCMCPCMALHTYAVTQIHINLLLSMRSHAEQPMARGGGLYIIHMHAKHTHAT